MNYVIFNQDGSIREQAFGYYIQQGDNANTIFVSVEGFTSEYVCNAFLTLPTTETLLLAGAYQNNVEYKEGEFADGWVITLSGRATEFNGSVMCAIRLFLNNQIKLSYPLMLIVNETGYRPNEDTGITIEEINSYLLQLQSYQLKYDLHNVRYYSSYSDYQLDLANLESGQLAIVKEDENIFAYVDNGKIDFDYATKEYVEEVADTKVDKITTSGVGDRVYGVNAGGGQTIFNTDRDYTIYAYQNYIVKRMSGGQIALPLLPERDENAISKHYADLTYATKEDVANIYDVLYETIIISAEEDFTGTLIVMPSTIILEDSLAHTIVESVPFALKAVKGKTEIIDNTIKNVNITKIVSNGFNQINNVRANWEILYSNYILSTPIDVIGGEEYTLELDFDNVLHGYIYELDDEGNTVKSNYVGKADPHATLLPTTKRVKVQYNGTFVSGEIPTINVCFHLTGNGSLDGTYKPYVAPKTYTLTISDLNGIGTAQDTITWDGTNRTETKVIEKVDLGTLDWVYSNGMFRPTNLPNIKQPIGYSSKPNALCIKYECVSNQTFDSGKDKCFTITDSTSSYIIRFRDTAYEDPITFKADMIGVHLRYEKTAPTITTTLETSLDIDFQTGGYLTIDSEVWADITAEFLVKDWSN